MSNALAIASVTAVLKDLLNNGIIDHDLASSIGNVTVTALPPDRIDTSATNQQSQLNVFLYQVTPNQGWRNVALPSRDSNGDRTSNPPLALNLHYLLTAYGASEFHSEILLGYGMQLLHETPVLPREAIQRALAPPTPVGGGLPPELRALFTSGLADQVEQLKITPEALTAEDIYKLWTAFDANYRPTAAYQISVVLIESRRSTRSALPVRERQVYVLPFNQPVIERVLSQANNTAPILPNQPILAGQNLVIEGHGLRADNTRVLFDDIEVTPPGSGLSDTRVIVPIPGGLPPGIHGVQIVHRLLMGVPAVLHRGFESNAAAFVLRPNIISANPTAVTDTGGGFRSATVVLNIDPGVEDSQRLVLLLNEFGAPMTRPARAYSFVGPKQTPTSPPGLIPVVSIPVTGVIPGQYLIRLQVDGAESPLTTDSTGLYTFPLITI